MNQCGACRFWERFQPIGTDDEGACLLFTVTELPKPDHLPEPLASVDGGGFDVTFATVETFGCVQWEAKP